MFRDALTYLRNDREEALTTVLLGGLLTFFSFLIVPQIVLLGYMVRVLRGTARGSEIPPTFDGWRELLTDGTKAYAIWLGWTLIPLLVRFGLNGGHLEPGQATFWLLGWMLAPNAIPILQLGFDTSGFATGLGFSEPYVDLFIVLYVIPAALANFAEKGTIRSGFFEGGVRRSIEWALEFVGRVSPHLADLAREVVRRVFSESEFAPVSTLTTRRYAISWIGYFALYLAAETVLRLFFYLPDSNPWIAMIYLFGALLGYFYLRVAGWTIIGRAWPAVRPIDGDTSVRSDRERDRKHNDYYQSRGRTRRHAPPTRRGLNGVAPKTVLVGGLLLSFNFLVLPGLLVGGYVVRVLRATAHDESIPLFSGMRGLFLDGMKAYAIWFGYTVIPTALLFVAVAQRIDTGSVLGNLAVRGVLTGGGLPGGFPAVFLSLLGGILVLLLLLFGVALLPSTLLSTTAAVSTMPVPVALVIFLLSVYVVPAAILRFAVTGSLRAGFALRSLVPTLWSGRYALRWSAATLLTLSGWAVFLGAHLLLIHPLLGDTPLVETVAGLEYIAFFAVPTSVSALLFWGLFIGSSIVYFVLLVVSCGIIGRSGTERERLSTSTDRSRRDSEIERRPL